MIVFLLIRKERIEDFDYPLKTCTWLHKMNQRTVLGSKNSLNGRYEESMKTIEYYYYKSKKKGRTDEKYIKYVIIKKNFVFKKYSNSFSLFWKIQNFQKVSKFIFQVIYTHVYNHLPLKLPLWLQGMILNIHFHQTSPSSTETMINVTPENINLLLQK